MRGLNSKQRNAIEKITNERDIFSPYDLTSEEYDMIFDMNPHETFWQNLQRYIFDKEMI